MTHYRKIQKENTMKKLLMIALAFGMLTGVQAQESGTLDSRVSKERQAMTPEQRAEKRTARMAESLSLSAEQKEKVYQIVLNQVKEADRLRETKEEVRDERAASLKKADAQISEILTEEQRVKWDAQKAEVRERRANKMEERKNDNTRQRGTVQPEMKLENQERQQTRRKE